ncbi:unnamed protein product [Schistocephalus solidus]|uniref:Jacalin-type lectin domain-containing protein n=1 Tax=Schistocephalus solidus TaxID=70667 RepID=A0A183TDL7_SCHSO|nr:unnamed protein product [Schistocephalus solidus]
MVQKRLAAVVRLWAQVSEPGTQAFVLTVQIDMAVDAVCVGVSSFEEFSCLLGVSHGDHFGYVPIEAVVTVYGVRKHEGQGIASADGQFMFVYAGPKLSTRGIQHKSLRFKPTLPNDTGKILSRKYGFQVLRAIISDVHHRLERFKATISDLRSRYFSLLPEGVLGDVQQRINTTTIDAMVKETDRTSDEAAIPSPSYHREQHVYESH